MERGWPHEDAIKVERDPDHIPSQLIAPTERERAIRNLHARHVRTPERVTVSMYMT
jgi:hypothetical protein